MPKKKQAKELGQHFGYTLYKHYQDTLSLKRGVCNIAPFGYNMEGGKSS